MRRISRLLPWASLGALLAACNGLLGIEDLYEGERPGAGGTSSKGEGGDGGTITAPGGDGSGGTITAPGGDGSGGTITAPGGGGGGAGAGSGGASSLGGDGSGGAITSPGGDGSGGASEPTGGSVTGHVIDFWGHPVPSLQVQIGATRVSTDENGAFTVADVPAEYDVSMVYSDEVWLRVAAWAYLGLTRRDPTLQVYLGAPERYGTLDVAFSPKPTLSAGKRIDVAVGSGRGSDVYQNVSVNGTASELPSWYGPTKIAATGHGLLWQRDAQGLPTGYFAYGSAPVQLASGSDATLTLNLSTASIASSKVAGTITPAGVASRRNWLFLRFDSDAALELVAKTDAEDTFSFLAPAIGGSSLTVAASEGYFSEQYAVAHADNLAPGAQVELTIPAPMVLQSPLEGATKVTGATRFSFSGAERGPYVVAFYDQGADDPNPPATPKQAVYVVTDKKQLTLPTFLGGDFSLYANRRYLWTVTTHGPRASVDELAAEGGYLDAFSWDEKTPQGPRRSQPGSFTDSGPRELRTAP
jgi:hypothetical protein